MKIAPFLIALLAICCSWPAAATLYIVDGSNPAASDSNPGTKALPLKTVSAAVAKTAPGDTVIVDAGVYREQVEIKTSGTAKRPIVIEAAPGADVILDEADIVTDWSKAGGASDRPLWQKTPFKQALPYPIDTDDLSKRTQLIVDNAQYDQVEHTEQLKPGTFFYDPSGDGTITVWPLPPRATAAKLAPGAQWWQNPVSLASDDLNKHVVEVATRSWGILGDGHLAYVTIRGLTVRHGGSALGIIFGGDDEPCHDINVENCTVEYAYAAFAARGDRFRISHCYFHDNGLGSGAGLTNSVMENTIFDHNTTYGTDHGFSAGGIKMLWTVNTTIRRCQFINNDGPGIWFDTGNANNIIEQNFCSYNSGSGIMMEVSPDFASADPKSGPIIDGWAPKYMGTKSGAGAGPNIIRNNVCVGNRWDGDQGCGILLQLASDEIVANNTLVDNAMFGIFVRYHPYNDWTHRCQDDSLINNLCVNNGGSQIYITPDPLDKPGIVSGNHSDYNLFWVTKSWLNENESTHIQNYQNDRSGYAMWGKTQDDLTYSVDETYKILGFEQHSIQEEPYFVSASTLDFGLQPRSFAIGAGIQTPYVTDDYLGRPRPADRPPSIGALEYIPGPLQPPAMPMHEALDQLMMPSELTLAN